MIVFVCWGVAGVVGVCIDYCVCGCVDSLGLSGYVVISDVVLLGVFRVGLMVRLVFDGVVGVVTLCLVCLR